MDSEHETERAGELCEMENMEWEGPQEEEADPPREPSLDSYSLFSSGNVQSPSVPMSTSSGSSAAASRNLYRYGGPDIEEEASARVEEASARGIQNIELSAPVRLGNVQPPSFPMSHEMVLSPFTSFTSSRSAATSRDLYRYGGPDIEEEASERWIQNMKLSAPVRDIRDGPPPSLAYFSANSSLGSDPSVNGPTTSVNSIRSITPYPPRSPEPVEQGPQMLIDSPNLNLSLSPSLDVDRRLAKFNSEVDGLYSKKSYFISARGLDIIWGNDPNYWSWKPHKDSRFPEVAVLKNVCWLEINGKIDLNLLSAETTYAVYLIYKLQSRVKGLKSPAYQTARIQTNVTRTERTVSLDSRELEAYEGGKGWNQIKLGEFNNNARNAGLVQVQLLGSEGLLWKSGLIIEGMEFRAEN